MMLIGRMARSTLVGLLMVAGGLSQATSTITSMAEQPSGNGGFGPPASISTCIPLVGAMQAGLPNDTSNSVSLCAVSGSLWNAMSTAQACVGRNVQNIPVPYFPQLNSVLAICNSMVSSSISSSCSELSAKSESCVVSTSIFGQANLAEATGSSGTQTLSATPTQTAANQPSATGSQAATENNSGSNIGLVAGVAVGAALGALIIACTAAFFIWRWRKQSKANQNRNSTLDDDAEKAQLPGDESKFGFISTRKELDADAGSERKELPSPPGYARNVGTLQEMDASNRKSVIKELASNEEVASEMATTEYTGTTENKSPSV